MTSKAVTLDECLDELEGRFVGEAFWKRIERRIVAGGGRLKDKQKVIQPIQQEIVGIKKSIALQLGDQPNPCKEAERLFLGSLMGRELYKSLSAADLVNTVDPRRKEGPLNERQMICLWLGLFRGQTSGLAGLWQLYIEMWDETVLDYLDEVGYSDLPLPSIIQTIFDPQGNDGENQDYVEKILEEANQASFDLTDNDTSKIIARTVETKLRHRMTANGVDQDLLRGGNTLMDEFVRRVCAEIDNF